MNEIKKIENKDEIINNKKDENNLPVSITDTLIVSFGAVSAGFVGGVLYQFRKSNKKLDFKKYDFLFAFKALFAGTCLCFGTFGLFGSLFVYKTGVRSWKDLRYYFESFSKGEKINGPSNEEIKYNKETKGMSFMEELDYLYTKYIEPEENKHNNNNNNNNNNNIENIKIDDSILKENITDEELLQWEKENQK